METREQRGNKGLKQRGNKRLKQRGQRERERREREKQNKENDDDDDDETMDSISAGHVMSCQSCWIALFLQTNQTLITSSRQLRARMEQRVKFAHDCCSIRFRLFSSRSLEKSPLPRKIRAAQFPKRTSPLPSLLASLPNSPPLAEGAMTAAVADVASSSGIVRSKMRS